MESEAPLWRHRRSGGVLKIRRRGGVKGRIGWGTARLGFSFCPLCIVHCHPVNYEDVLLYPLWGALKDSFEVVEYIYNEINLLPEGEKVVNEGGEKNTVGVPFMRVSAS